MKKIKEIALLRRLYMPIRDAKLKRTHERYLRSSDSWYLKTLKGIHAGKRCFIIGNGPSLCAKDLDRLTGELTFAANRIYRIFDQTKWRPTYYLHVDIPLRREMEEEIRTHAAELGHIFTRVDIKDPRDEERRWEYPIEKLTKIFFEPDMYFRIYLKPWNQWRTYISEDISSHVTDGATVTFESIQMAIYMGFTEIYLLGVDFNYSVVYDAEGKVHIDDSVVDYFDGKRYDTTMCNFNTMLHGYQTAREYCDNHQIRIMNATRGGKLEVFERVDFDELLKGKNNVRGEISIN